MENLKVLAMEVAIAMPVAIWKVTISSIVWLSLRFGLSLSRPLAIVTSSCIDHYLPPSRVEYSSIELHQQLLHLLEAILALLGPLELDTLGRKGPQRLGHIRLSLAIERAHEDLAECHRLKERLNCSLVFCSRSCLDGGHLL